MQKMTDEKIKEYANGLVDKIEETFRLLNNGTLMNYRHNKVVNMVVQFAESYHEKQCAKCTKCHFSKPINKELSVEDHSDEINFDENHPVDLDKICQRR
jgi:NADH:ubiquinone oxidoreductase subunit F (NADH-binding)